MSTTTRSTVSRLHGLFTKNPVAAPAATAAGGTSPVTTPAVATTKSGRVKELYKARSLERLVAMFKESSKERRFRARWGIYEETVRRLMRANRHDWIEEILEEQKKYPDVSREGFNVRLIRLYGDAGMFEHARKVFDEMPGRSSKITVLSFNALLAAAVHSKKYDVAKELFEELPAKMEIKPDVFSYNIVVKGLCEAGSLDAAASLIDEMEEKQICQPNVVTFNTLLDGFYSNSRFDEGDAIWARLMKHQNVSPDVKSYSAKFMGLAKQKRAQEAVELVVEMKEKGLEPDAICWHNLIKGFVNEANVEAAKQWYGEMRSRECKPHRMTFAALIPFVCGEGDDAGFGFKLAMDIFGTKQLVDQGLLQRVVDALAKAGKVKEAEEVVALGMNNGYYQYSKLCLPSTGVA
ncbi:unnamed protein product [Linum tenue]|uniref:Pentatricopeptide repeat-containing protein n=1 Tax=Linum tenue TaxID=586396 RepID=A0AAV0PBQ4_9ROSI|nr:unnamed protein product [Linum tenue]